MILLNLRRTTECSYCERPGVPVTDNVKLNGDESDKAELCRSCEQLMRAGADYLRNEEEQRDWRF